MPVGVEDIKFAIVFAERRARVGRAIVGGGLVEALSVADEQLVDHFQQLIAVVGKILQDVYAVGERHHRHQIGTLHVLGDEIDGRGFRAQLVGRRHRAHVEIQHQQPAIPVFEIPGRLGGDLNGGNGIYLNRLLSWNRIHFGPAGIERLGRKWRTLAGASRYPAASEARRT